MAKELDKMLFSNVSLFGKYKMKTVDLLAFLAATLLALLARTALFDHVSNDYTQFLLPWYEQLKAAGGLPGLSLSLGDYTPPYLLFLAILTYLPIDPLQGIKVFSILFDFLMAIYVAKLVQEKRGSMPITLAAYTLTLFIPTVLLNSGLWGQCDGLFTAFLVMSLYYFVKDRPLAGMICFSISFVFKLQAIFLAPVLALLLLYDRIKLRHFLAIPAVYFIGILPAWIAGRPLGELLTIYFRQTGTYNQMSMNATNLYIFIEKNTSELISSAAIFLAGTVVLLSLYLLYHSRMKLTWDNILLAALYFALLLPYFLPHMHERYFYLADVLSLLVAFHRPKRFYLPIMVGFASAASYIPYLFGGEPINLGLAAVIVGAALGITGYDLFREAYAQPAPAAKK